MLQNFPALITIYQKSTINLGNIMKQYEVVLYLFRLSVEGVAPIISEKFLIDSCLKAGIILL